MKTSKAVLQRCQSVIYCKKEIFGEGVFSDVLRIGICDDEKNTCHLIENSIHRIAEESGFSVDTEVFFSGRALSCYLDRGENFDVIFLDIEMEHLNGIDVSEKIRKDMGDISTEIVYVSCTTEYDRRLFDYHPLAFITKPADKAQIGTALSLAQKRKNIVNPCFSFSCNRKTYNIPYKNILYFESADRKIDIITADQTYSFYGNLSQTGKNLPGCFCQIHRAYIVNLRQIAHYGGREVTMNNGRNISIGKNYREDFFKCQLADTDEE